MSPVDRLRPVYDVVVVGARCAGAATAMLLAREGLSVLAIDRAPAGSDTLSTHALMRGGIVQLSRWGLLDRIRAAGTPAVRQVAFHYGARTVDIEIKPKDGVDALFAPRRTVLDVVLADAAREAGVTVVHGARAVDLTRTVSNRVDGVVLQTELGRDVAVRARVVVGADGARSTVARLAGSRIYRSGSHTTGVVYGYFDGLPIEGYHWLFDTGAAAGAIQTNDGLTCVFGAASSERFRVAIGGDLDRGLRRLIRDASPQLDAIVADRRPVGRLRGFAGQPAYLRQSAGAGWALVGDAGYFKDTITAHGITDALRDAELLARALVRGSDVALADYQTERDAHADRLFDVHDEIASFSWSLDSLPELHRRLSQGMSREATELAALPAQELALAGRGRFDHEE